MRMRFGLKQPVAPPSTAALKAEQIEMKRVQAHGDP
jgi:hypothetical protein